MISDLFLIMTSDIPNPTSEIPNKSEINMSESTELGRKGENRATEYLRNQGYEILYRNWTWGKHEIDIVARKDDTIIFIEVKARSEDYLDDLIKIVSPSKQKSIILAADGYIRRFGIESESRFDILFIIEKGKSFEIKHIEDAFYPTLR